MQVTDSIDVSDDGYSDFISIHVSSSSLHILLLVPSLVASGCSSNSYVNNVKR